MFYEEFAMSDSETDKVSYSCHDNNLLVTPYLRYTDW